MSKASSDKYPGMICKKKIVYILFPHTYLQQPADPLLLRLGELVKVLASQADIPQHCEPNGVKRCPLVYKTSHEQENV